MRPCAPRTVIHACYALLVHAHDDAYDGVVGSAGSRTGLTVKVLGWAPSAPSRHVARRGRLLKVIVAPKDHPPEGRWWGATAMEANESDRKRYEEE